jgi:aspartyl-tRNA(Asn)/glutamyl-tRNA(Gln) amidotransferase subunit A
MDVMQFSACELSGLIRSKELSPVEVVSAALNRIESQPDINAFVTVTAEQAMAQAHIAERQVMGGEALGPLHGIPYSVKDLIATEGVRTTMGSPIFADNIPAKDAVSVARSKSAGAILIGKTTTPEFGHKQSPYSPVSGWTLNPVNKAFTPGASSSGAAAAVAAGMGPIALGSDGGGSIRIPSACCGIVGLKPTLGAVPHLQAPDLFGANSFVGPMARNVADTRLLFEVIRGGSYSDPYGQGEYPDRRPMLTSIEGLRVAWLPSAGNPVDPQVLKVTENAVHTLQLMGAKIETVELDFVQLEKHFLVMLQSLLAARVGPHLERFGSSIDPTLLETVLQGQRHSAVTLHEASFARTSTFDQFQRLFTQYDVLVSPTVSAPPLPLDMDISGNIDIAGVPAGTIRGAWYPYTYPMNMTGHPALSMPCGVTAQGLPVGLQLAGRWHDDIFLLEIAAHLERALSA